MKKTFHGADTLEIISPSARFRVSTEFNEKAPSSSARFRVSTEFNEKAPPKAPPSDKKYTGPQNARELMKALDADYNKGHAKTEVSVSRKGDGIETESYSSNLTTSEIDARYPRAEWLQLLLERGIIIENFHEYTSHLSRRHALALLEDNPNLWQSGILDIPPTDDWETYKAAYIDKLVEIEGKKAEIESTKVEIECTIERVKEQVERAKVQIEQSKKDVERAQKKLNSQQLEHVRRQLEHARKQIARAQEALEHLKEPTSSQE